MKIGILTFHCAINYGAVLQAYGLQEYLKSLGHEVYIIDYRPHYLLELYRIIRWKHDSKNSITRNFKWVLRQCLTLPIRWRRNKKFCQFVNKYLNLYSLDLNKSDNNFDMFIFGSDQIWNPCITYGFDKVYFGDFPAAKNKKLVSYAASVGSVSFLTPQDTIYLKSKLKSFSLITVRERILANYLKEECGIIAKVAPDPVLLAGYDIYVNLAIEIKEKSPYLLLFTLGRDEATIKTAHEIAKQKQLQIVEIMSSKESLYNRKIKQTLSPCEFLGYLKYASFVVTSSFHGTVFSILFKKEFKVVLCNEMIGERINSLLKDKNLLDNAIWVK